MTDRFSAPLPTLRALTRALRELNRAFSHPAGGPEHVHLVALESDFPLPDRWDLSTQPEHDMFRVWHTPTSVLVPGDCGDLVAIERPDGRLDVSDGSKFDAVAAARRLLADARAKGYR